MDHSKNGLRLRKFKANWRDTLLLLSKFRSPLIFFIFAIAGSGLFYFILADLAQEPVKSLPEAVYLVLTLTFLQPSGEFPRAWFLQCFFFVMPILGIGILAQGLADFGLLLFNRRARGKEWEMAVASTYNQHIILIGLGHLGYRVVQSLHDMHQDVVVITLDPGVDLVAKVQQYDIPVIQDDGSRESVLKAAGVERAHAIMLCTQNDSLNLQMAVKARTLNPQIEVVIRIFDEDFAQALTKQFGFHAFSATGMAAPVFAALAVNIDMTPPINIAGVPNSLARLEVKPHTKITGKLIDQIESDYSCSIVLLVHNGVQHLHPKGDLILQPGDTIAILGRPEQITVFVNDSE